jgi:hypothetical protein
MKRQPFFMSAPRLVIGIRSASGFQKLAYAIGLSMNMSVNVQPVYCLGDIGPISYEPIQYQPITGSFQIFRLQTAAQRTKRTTNSQSMYAGNTILTAGTIGSSVKDTTNAVTENNDLSMHLDPNKIITSSTFDIEIYLNVNGYGHEVSNVDVAALAGATATTATDLALFMTLKDCRLTGRNVNIAQGQIINEPMNFMGLLAVQSTKDPEKLDSLVRE